MKKGTAVVAYKTVEDVEDSHVVAAQLMKFGHNPFGRLGSSLSSSGTC